MKGDKIMSGRIISFIFIIIFLMGLRISPVHAEWQDNGVPVCVGPSTIDYPVSVSDGIGGAFIFWASNQSGDFYMYAQRVDSIGNIYWDVNGVPIASIVQAESYAAIPDGAGGSLIAWEDWQSNLHVRIQRIDENGNVQWTPEGTSICEFVKPGDKIYPQLIPDNSGGAIVTWEDYRNGNYDIYAQRIDSDGNAVWTLGGLPVCDELSHQKRPEIVTDGAGGAIIAWIDQRFSIEVIYAQHMDSLGNALWTNDGVAICTASNSQTDIALAPDGVGGAIIAWRDGRNYSDDIYSQRIDTNCLPMWSEDGVIVCDSPNTQYKTKIISDDQGCVIVAWLDYRNVTDPDIYAQKIDTSGTMLWIPNGEPVSTASNTQSWDYVADMISDGSGGCIIAWYDGRHGPFDIYAQRLDSSGYPKWMANGVTVCDYTGNQTSTAIVSDGCGGAIISWHDERHSGGSVYTQRVRAQHGLWEDADFKIASIQDVPNDQGGWVLLRWQACSEDSWSSQQISHYSIWRAINSSYQTSNFEDVSNFVDASAVTRDFQGPAARIDKISSQDYYWEWIGNVNAYHFQGYAFTAPTLYDSTGNDPGIHFFQVLAHTDEQHVFWQSPPDSAYSVDNLPPHMPTGFMGVGIINDDPMGLQLSWDENNDPDIHYYTLHQGQSEDFVPDESNFLISTSGNSFLDENWAIQDLHHYKIAAVDIHGNISAFSGLGPADVVIGLLLQSYSSSVIESGIEITWELTSHISPSTQHILRKIGPNGIFEEISSPKIEQIDLTFTFRDESIEPGTTYRYRIEIEEEFGNRRVLFETDNISTPGLPITLFQNHPNPFNPSTTIKFYLPFECEVTLEIYDSAGRLISRLLDRNEKSKGMHQIEWAGAHDQGYPVASGVYFYRLIAGKEMISRKMVLLR
jgi:hypothetical protein